METYKYFVFSDVHGEYEALKEALNIAGYESHNPHHVLVSLGDDFDRGPNSAGIYDFLERTQAICVKGNHDNFLQEFLEKGADGEFVLFNMLHNGLTDTLTSFSHGGYDITAIKRADLDRLQDYIKHNYPRLLKWLQSKPLYYETENYIFCHAGLDPSLHNWKDTPEDYILWDINDSYKSIPSTRKTVIIGHHHAAKVRELAALHQIKEQNIEGLSPGIRAYGNTDENKPYRYKNKIAIDGLTNLTHKVNVLVIEDRPLPNDNNSDVSINADEVKLKVNHMDEAVVRAYGDSMFYYMNDNGTTTLRIDPNMWTTYDM